jgi:hypothetical protein
VVLPMHAFPVLALPKYSDAARCHCRISAGNCRAASDAISKKRTQTDGDTSLEPERSRG